MVSSGIQALKRDLRSRLGRFVAADCKRSFPHVYSVLEDIRNNGYPAFLCGGAVRSFLLSNHGVPRDLDIILGYVSREQLEASFTSHISHKTGLGGLRLQVKDWSIDMWPIQETWAFREGKVAGRGFSDYPKTVFLNIDAIAIQLFSRRRQKRTIYSKGFFEAIAERTIELNFEENPAPAQGIAKALRIAEKFRFVIGPRLARYMLSYTNQMAIEELAAVYRRRYVGVNVTPEKLYNCFKSIETQMRASHKKPVNAFAEQNSNLSNPTTSLLGKTRNLSAMP